MQYTVYYRYRRRFCLVKAYILFNEGHSVFESFDWPPLLSLKVTAPIISVIKERYVISVTLESSTQPSAYCDAEITVVAH